MNGPHTPTVEVGLDYWFESPDCLRRYRLVWNDQQGEYVLEIMCKLNAPGFDPDEISLPIGTKEDEAKEFVRGRMARLLEGAYRYVPDV
jgi:hypothetical protein